MAAFLDLPDECILRIVAYLLPRQIERLARTFHKRLYYMSLPALGPLLKARQDERYILDFFGHDENHSYQPGVSRETFEALKLEGWEYSKPRCPSHHLEYMNLDGTLQWLRGTDRANGGCGDGDIKIGHSEVSSVIERASALGLTLPTIYRKLLLNRDPHNCDCYISFECDYFDSWRVCKLIRSARSAESQTGSAQLNFGYVVVFHYETPDSSEEGTWELYLDTQGRSAVVRIQGGYDFGSGLTLGYGYGFGCDGYVDLDGHWVPSSAIEKEWDIVNYGPVDNIDCQLESTDLEGWLVIKAFTEQADALAQDRIWGENEQMRNARLPKHLQDYLYNVYTEKGRMMQ